MKSEFLCAYCDTSLSWIDWSAIVDFLYEMLSLSLVNKGTFIVFSMSPRHRELLGRLCDNLCLVVRTWTHKIENYSERIIEMQPFPAFLRFSPSPYILWNNMKIS